jgi:uncharacterized protein (DUF488 family)
LVITGIGYQGRTPEEFTALLTAAGISVVIDIRETAWSRKPGFSKTKLAERLGKAGIRYVHMRAAGNPKENRRTAQSVEECLERYRAYVAANPRFLKEIYEVASGSSVALLCYEAATEDCHRSVIFEELASRWGELAFRSL